METLSKIIIVFPIQQSPMSDTTGAEDKAEIVGTL
uniref:Uncharacterized protein n=1 Tax=Neisseria meningitidis alpha275 TaxID=295996 RepID=C6SNL0_NEIME|nr:hypothetical protein predicted by Glimmer/Critica [Neisseria meningitidis alpha275]